ncbi:MAG: radical SAM protein [Gemmatimonadota bacterium]|nr:MAG: radical SAM protein [Gemmatimonadota bacterium]
MNELGTQHDSDGRQPVIDAAPNPNELFRLPWTASDNAMTWLEPTRRCNITCDACFVENDQHSDKTTAQIRHELEVMLSLRKCDAMLIAGGEPLVHPDIIDIVRMVTDFRVKPVIVTNGVRLDRALLRELKLAGAHGLTLHVDSHQARPGWLGKSEAELNELRGHFADMIYDEGDLTCAFNTTIFPDTLACVPEIVDWAVGVPDRVQVLTLICVRMANAEAPYDYYVGGRPVDFVTTPYVTEHEYGDLMTEDIYRQIRQVLPDFEFCAYLGGTVNPQSLKWVVGCHVASKERSYGMMGPRTMELLQNGHHAFRRRYLAFSPPSASRAGRSALLLGLFDRSMRRAARGFVAAAFTHPRILLRRLYLQTISVVQPVDILPTGECDRCDGCPNKTFWEDRLVPACRAEEYRRFGAPVEVVPRAESAE